MYQSHQGGFRQQFNFLRQQFLQEGQLPFADVFSTEVIAQALQILDVRWKHRIFTPLVTLWVFLSQVLSGDHSCCSALSRLIAHRVAHGQPACSARTGAYCQARKRLPEKFFATVACLVGRELDAKVDPHWLWKGRRVYLFDGTTVNMPDTPENQAAYPQVYNQKQGLGFPIARVGAIISLACGAILNLGICQYAGEEQGEVSLLRKLWDILCPSDILLTDRLMANWLNICELKQRGIELVGRLNKANRRADFRRGMRLGPQDHIVLWPKPSSIRSVNRETFHALPDFVTVREAKIQIKQRGFRTKSIVVVTTLLDPREVTKADLGALYLARWNNELDLRAIKSTMQMDELRCKTPEMVHKEIWAHVLAYNLIRTVMAQAASKHDLLPRTISFKAAIQTLEAFQPVIELQSGQGPAHRFRLYHDLLDAVATHEVGNRPGRFEPRAKKHRRNHYNFLMRPRAEIKRDMARGVIII
jgi:Transposase DDE domain